MAENQETDAIKIISNRYRSVEEAIKILGRLLDVADQKFSDETFALAFKGASLSLFQGLLDLANGLLLSQDITPTRYEDLIEFLRKKKIVSDNYAKLLKKIVLIRNALLFLHEEVEIEELYVFIKMNMNKIKEIYHSFAKLFGEI